MFPLEKCTHLVVLLVFQRRVGVPPSYRFFTVVLVAVSAVLIWYHMFPSILWATFSCLIIEAEILVLKDKMRSTGFRRCCRSLYDISDLISAQTPCATALAIWSDPGGRVEVSRTVTLRRLGHSNISVAL